MKKLLLFIALLISGMGLNAQSIGDNVVIDYNGYSLKYTVTSLTPPECEVVSDMITSTDIVIPSIIKCENRYYSVTSIGGSAFSGCSSLTSIEMPNVTSIGESAFSGCSSLTSIDIPNGVTSIGEAAFSGCSSLTSIEIPNSITSIGYRAFEYCSRLDTIYCYAENVPSIVDNNYFFEYCPVDMIIYVPAVSLTSYQNQEPWNEYTILPLSSYNIINTINPENSGMVIQKGEYGWVTLEAIPNIGYKFVNWTENGEMVSTDAEYMFKLTCDKEFVANFSLLDYDVMLSVNNEAAGSVTGAGNYNHGDNVTLTATPNEGYDFVNWTENGEVISTDAEYSFTITSDKNLVANFTLLDYDVIVSVNPESAGSVTGAGNYHHGEEVTLTVTPNEGYAFVNWTESGEVVSTDAEYSFTITSDKNLVANFSLLDYDVILSVNKEAAGSVTGAGNYHHGEEVTLTATANEGYAFLNWTENGVVVSEDAEYSFVILKDRNLVANFIGEDIPLNVVATAIDDNTIKVEWNAIASAESYNVYRASLTRNSEYEFIVNVKETSFTDTGLDANTKYFYSVTAVYADGSESEKSESAEATTKPESIEELTLSFNIYPNPVSDMLFIETEVEIEEVSIFDIYGRRQELSLISCQPSAIDVSGLNSGVYFVKVVTSEGEAMKRIVKK